MTEFNNTYTLLAFIFGATFGSVVTYYVIKNKFDSDLENSITEEELEAEKEKVRNEFIKANNDVDDILKSNDYVAKETTPQEVIDESDEDIYIIPIEEYGELYDYEEINLTLYADGILTDEDDEMIDDPEELIGSGNLKYLRNADQLSDMIGDSIFIRNDAKKCDYEVSICAMSYDEIAEERPNIVLHREEEYD